MTTGATVARGLLVSSLLAACAGGTGGPAELPGPGDTAPEFSLPSAAGNTVSLADFRGRNVLLYFSMGPG